MTPRLPLPVRVSAVVFDLDGTLVDSFDAIADGVNHARLSFGLPRLPVETVRSKVGRGAATLLAETVGEDRVEVGLRLFRARYAEIYLEATSPLPGVSETLGDLRARGLRLAVASNKPGPFTEGLVRRFGWDRFVHAVESPETAGAAKPDPAMIRRALQALEAEPADSLYVGDMPLDAESGARAGVGVVLVATGPVPPEGLRATGFPVVASLREIVPLLFPGRPVGD